jgi:diadenosine tetraphosphate (Ap4A) HIT family hydrolase
MTMSEWQRQASATSCPIDHPRPEAQEHWDLVAKLKAGSLYLGKNQTYRGHCSLVLDVRHAARPDQLSNEEWLDYSSDIRSSVAVIMRIVKADHVNIETLGNVFPHMHTHIVPRYENDPRWGLPIWTTATTDMLDTRLDPAEHAQLLQQMRDAFK